MWDAPNTYGRTPSRHFNFTEWWRSPSLDPTNAPTPDETMKNIGPHSMQNAVPRTIAVKKSYNTPLVVRDLSVYNSVFNSEYPCIRFLEAHGFELQYVSGGDAHLGRGAGRLFPQSTKVFLSVGHDEYWSAQQRGNVERLRDGGTHLAFLSGNEVYWSIRWEDAKGRSVNEETGTMPRVSGGGPPPGGVGGENKCAADADQSGERRPCILDEEEDPPLPTTLVTYKESQSARRRDPRGGAEWTGTFRDDRPINPIGPRPENALTGTAFSVNALRNDVLEVPYRYAKLRFWRNTELARDLHTDCE